MSKGNGKSVWLPIIVLLVVMAVTALMVRCAFAGSVTFCDVCKGYTISRKGDALLIRCPDPKTGKIDVTAPPWMTMPNCANPSAKTTPNGGVQVTCR